LRAVLYLETNFLVGAATARFDPQPLLAAAIGVVQLVIPRACFTEAVTTMERLTARRRQLSNLLDRRMRKLRTELFVPAAAPVIAHLDAAFQANNDIALEVRQRLVSVVRAVGTAAVALDEPPELVADVLADFVVEQPTDNLILHTIVRHAAEHPDLPKAFFTQDKNRKGFGTDEARAALRAAGVAVHARFDSVVQWLRHQPQQ